MAIDADSAGTNPASSPAGPRATIRGAATGSLPITQTSFASWPFGSPTSTPRPNRRCRRSPGQAAQHCGATTDRCVPRKTTQHHVTAHRRSSSLVGADERCSTSCPTKRCGAALILSASSSRCRLVSAAPRTPTMTAADGANHKGIQISQYVAQRCLIATPPGLDRGQPQWLTKQPFAQLGEKWHQGRILHGTGTEVVQYTDAALADAFQQSGDTEPESGRSSRASIHSESTRRSITSTCSSLPGTRIQTRPSRTVRSLPSSKESPAVKRQTPGQRRFRRGSLGSARQPAGPRPHQAPRQREPAASPGRTG